MLSVIPSLFRRLGRDTRGASAVEYAILVGLIGGVIFVGVGAFGTGLNTVFSGLMAKVGL